jgi:signal transduction histidine kinase
MDVTEEVIKERRRLELESKLRQQQKLESIGLLAGGVAHEINNPVNGIMNYGQLILDSENIDEDTRTFASEIVHESERVSGIVSNLLKFSRHGRKTRIPVEFKDILERTLSLVNMVFKKDNIKIITDIKDDLPKVKCNPQEIQQVLLNLITNSRDALNKKYAGEDGNKTVTISMDKMNKDGGDYLEVVVEDFGMGIDPEILDRLFDPFFTTKGPGEGTGLGLSISYGIIEEHGGALWVESEKGKYTRFHIELPLG